MYDGGKIGAGIVLFAALVGFPFWYTAAEPAQDRDGDGTPDYKAVPQLPKDQEGCIESTEYMRASHMQLLLGWRDDVVRYSDRTYVATKDGQEWEKSLSRTCMSCHTSTAAFCDECHTFLGVTPDCWTCHVKPEMEAPPLAQPQPEGRK